LLVAVKEDKAMVVMVVSLSAITELRISLQVDLLQYLPKFFLSETQLLPSAKATEERLQFQMMSITS